jgi:hypothetical protein
MGVYGKTQEAHQRQAHTQLVLFPSTFQLSSDKGREVIGPNHVPHVDVKQGTARAWNDRTIAFAPWIAHVLAAVHASGNGAVVPWPRLESEALRQFTQNVREGNTIHHRLLGWQVHELRSNMGSAGPPVFGLSRAIIVQGLDKRTLALPDATCVGADLHLENQINASIPALIDDWAE